MFERYTEPARRSIFFARHEAAMGASSHIEPEHLFLGLLREDKSLRGLIADLDALREELTSGKPVEHPGGIDVPMSIESKRALAVAAQESEALGHKVITPQHLLLGLLKSEDSPVTRALEPRGVSFQSLRESLASIKEHAQTPERTRLHELVDMLPDGAIPAATSILGALQGWPR